MRRKRVVWAATLMVFGLGVACAARKPGSPLHPGLNLFSKEQDIQIGQEASKQVQQQFEIVQNRDLQAYIDRIGKRLASQKEADDYPYSFTMLNDKQINAFALPGGPTYVFSGILAAADNEAQVVGVMAHEISHVALRHGTNQVSKANLLQIPAAIAGAAIGEGALGQVVQLGLGVGLNGLFLKYSRTAESQADALGARIMAGAGYNPIEMARFFEKLEAEGGQRAPEFLSDHPNPGNRVKNVEAEIRTFPQRQYNAEGGDFKRMAELARQLPPPSKRPQQRQAVEADGTAGGFKQLQTRTFAIDYPANWQTFGDNNSSMITLAPREGVVQGQQGAAIGYGAVLSYFFPENAGGDLRRATDELIHHLHATDPKIQVAEQPRRVRVAGSNGLMTRLSNDSPFDGQGETDLLVTVARPEGLFYMLFIAPQKNFSQAEPAFQQMLRSLKFGG